MVLWNFKCSRLPSPIARKRSHHMYSNHEIYDQIIQTCKTTLSINIKNNPLKGTNYDKTVFIDVASPFFF